MITLKIYIRFCLAFLLVSFALSSGCSRKDHQAKTATQVAAKVNADEITVSQVNYGLSRARNIPPDSVAMAKREILAQLINQDLAKQQAI